MAPDIETQKPSPAGSAHMLFDEMSAASGNHNNKDQEEDSKPSTPSPKEASFQEILIHSLDQARPAMSLLSEKAQEVASKTMASVREWSAENDVEELLSNPRNIQLSTEQREKIAQITACCKPSGNHYDDLDTTFTYETEDVYHAKMMQRLASWNTLETSSTLDEEHMMLVPQQESNKKSVQFDYPPVQAMSEIPRVQSKDIPNLFYSEEELCQLRGDRISLLSAEEVEAVAQPAKEEQVSTSNVTDPLVSATDETSNPDTENSPSSQRNVHLLTSSTGRPVREYTP